jgi:superkiller protein 3
MPRLAERAILDAVTLDPDHPSVRYTAAVIFNGTGRADRAVEQLEQIVQTHPNDAAYRLLGEITARQGDVERGLAYVDRAIALRPGFWENHGARGMICLRSGRNSEAIASFERVIELQPDSAWGYQFLGAAQQSAGDRESALASYQRSLAYARSAATLSNIGTLQYEQGRFAEAARAFEEALTLRPRDPRLHNNAGDAYRRLNDPARARQAYERAVLLTREGLAVNDADPRWRGFLALVLAKLGRSASARREVEVAATSAPGDPEVLYYRTVVLALAGSTAEALAALRAAVQAGFPTELARTDHDLGRIRNEPEFAEILSREE